MSDVDVDALLLPLLHLGLLPHDAARVVGFLLAGETGAIVLVVQTGRLVAVELVE